MGTYSLLREGGGEGSLGHAVAGANHRALETATVSSGKRKEGEHPPPQY